MSPSAKLVLLLVLLSSHHVAPAAALFSAQSIAEMVWDWIASTATAAAKWIWEGILAMLNAIANWIKNFVSELLSDAFKGLSASNKAFRKHANATLSRLFGGVPVSPEVSFLVNIMHKGALPDEWYFKPIRLDEEVQQLEKWLDVIQNTALAWIAALIVLHVAVIALLIRIKGLEKESARLDEREEEREKEWEEREERKRKREARRRVRRT